MESEKVKEIKNWLYERSDGKLLDNSYNLVGITYGDILTLINELESENKELAKQCEDWCEITLKKRNKIIELKDRIAELEKENGELKERLTVFNPISAFADNYAKGVKEAEKVVAEALKQFAEMLIDKKIKLGDRFNIYDIDKTLKEFIK